MKKPKLSVQYAQNGLFYIFKISDIISGTKKKTGHLVQATTHLKNVMVSTLSELDLVKTPRRF